MLNFKAALSNLRDDGCDVHQGQRRRENLDRAVDKQVKTIDFPLTAERNTAAAKRYFGSDVGS
ncbi:hypothetical protein ACFOY5_20590 [Massilia aurea]|uniref:transposase n=1 Tax=Massilia aurea TaxID=373040 RepID=UPI0021620BEF|nr:transposase [Massilia aurea]MCS0710050.1 transposase [Massilia aurea]